MKIFVDEETKLYLKNLADLGNKIAWGMISDNQKKAYRNIHNPEMLKQFKEKYGY